jgi:hypothetical protein
MIKKLNKKGEDSLSPTIIGVIILAASFVIILLFVLVINPTKTSDEAVCHNSVLTRSTGVLPADTIPLNCKTNYICISKDGSCEKMTSPEVMKVNTINDIYSVLATQMADCWWMFGEGKLNYVKKDTESQLYCSICSQVSFDDSVKKIIPSGQINKANLYDYLSYNNVSGKDISYLDYLVGVKNSQDIKNYLRQDNSNIGKVNINFGNINLSKQYFIVMGVFSDISKWKVALETGIGGAAIVAGSIILIAATAGAALPAIPFIIATVAGGAAGSTGGYLIATGTKGESGQDFLSPTIIEINSEDYTKLECKNVNTLA